MKLKFIPFGRFAPIIKNASWLSVFEILRIAMPLIALPYLFSVVGEIHYGTVVFVQSIIACFTLLINFGLDTSAVREVAINRSDKQQLSKIVSSVLIIKILLCVVSFLLMNIILYLVPEMGALSLLFYYAFIACLSDIFLPVWYFLGKEEMKKLTFIRFYSIVFYTGSIFIWIKMPDDYPRIALLQSISFLLSSAIACYHLFVKDKIRFHIPPASFTIQLFKDASPFFMSRASLFVNMYMAKIMSYFFLSEAVVSAFEVAQKIINGGLVPAQMLNQTLYPYMSKSQDKDMLRHSFRIVALLTTCVSVILFLSADFVVYLLSKGHTPEAVIILRILCLYLFFAGFSLFLGSPTLVAFGHQKPFNMSVVWSSVVLIVCYAVMIISGNSSFYWYAIALVAAELMVLSYRFYYCRKAGLIMVNC